MVVNIFSKNWIFAILFSLPALFLFGSCGQYDYSSPSPGTIELRLRSYYNNFDTSFALNNFTLKVTTIEAIRSDGVLANVFQDVKSIGPSADIYNAFGKDAYDSAIVLGRYPMPPADYNGLRLSIEPGPNVILDGYRTISVQTLPAELYTATVELGRHFTIQEAKTTTIVLTVDLDATLQKLAYTFQYVPRYTVSSVSVH
jgi:hypothetical protein